MADENKTQTTGDVRQIKETQDVLDQKGQSIDSANSPLAKIFDAIEGGKPRDEAIKSVMEPGEETTDDKPEEQVEVNDKPEDTEVDDKSIKDESEGKPEDKPEDKPDDKDDKPEEDDVPEDEQQVLPHDKPKTARRIQALLDKAKKAQESEANTKKEVEAKTKELERLQQELEKLKSANPDTNDDIQKQREELAMYRRRYQLENDPQVKERFDGKIESSEKAIFDSLKRRNANDALIEIIKEEGGWLKFSQSDRTIKMADGSEVSAFELYGQIKDALPPRDRRMIDALELEQIQAEREKQVYLETETKAAKDYFKNIEEQQQKQAQLQQEQIQKIHQEVAQWREGLLKNSEFLQLKDESTAASEAEKAAIRENNEFTKQLIGILDKNTNVKDLPSMLEVVAESVKYHAERRKTAALAAHNQTLENQLKEKNALIEKLRKGGSTTPKGGSIATGSSSPAQEDKKPESLEEALFRIEQGKA